MNKQTINITLFNKPDDYKCLFSELKIEANIITAEGEKQISKTLTKFNAESMFSLIKDFINSGIEKEEEK